MPRIQDLLAELVRYMERTMLSSRTGYEDHKREPQVACHSMNLQSKPASPTDSFSDTEEFEDEVPMDCQPPTTSALEEARDLAKRFVHLHTVQIVTS